MDREFSFEALPFEIYPEFGGELQESDPELGDVELEEEFRGRFPSRRAGFGSRIPRGGRQRLKRQVPSSRRRPKKPIPRPPCPPGRRPCPPWGVVGGPYGIVSEPYPGEPTYPMEPEPVGSEHVRWVQDCLNHALRLQLPLHGVMGVETRSAVRSFQRQQGLRVSGIVGLDTEEALKRVCSGAAPQASDDTQATGEFGLEAEEEGLGDIFGRIRSGIGSTYGRALEVAEIDREFGRKIIAALNTAKVTPPQYQDVGPLTRSTLAKLSGPGLYVIKGHGKKPYVGETTDLKVRLLQHLWCAEHLGVPTTHYRVFIAPRPNVAKAALRAEEKRINSVLVPKGLVTNQRKELEQELWGEAWN